MYLKEGYIAFTKGASDPRAARGGKADLGQPAGREAAMAAMREYWRHPATDTALSMAGWTVAEVRFERTAAGRPLKVFVVARTKPERPSVCPKGCSGSVFRGNGRSPRTVVDLPAQGHAVRWEILQARFQCTCCRSIVNERLPRYVDRGNAITARAHVYLRHASAFRPFKQVAMEVGVDEAYVRRLVKPDWAVRRLPKNGEKFEMSLRVAEPELWATRRRRRAAINAPTAPRYLGIDEICLADRRPKRRSHIVERRTVFVDLESGRVLDVILRNRAADVARWLVALPDADRIRGVAMDLCDDYRVAVRKVLPDVTIVADRFHVETLVQTAMDRVRLHEAKRMDREADARKKLRQHSDNSSKLHARLVRSREPPKSENKQRLLNAYLKSHPRTRQARDARRAFREIFDSRIPPVEARRRFEAWEASLGPGIKRHFRPVLRRIREYEASVFAFFALRITNGPTESANGTMRRLLRSGSSLHIQTLRDKVRVQGRLTPQASFFCDGCQQRSPVAERHVDLRGDLWCDACHPYCSFVGPRTPADETTGLPASMRPIETAAAPHGPRHRTRSAGRLKPPPEDAQIEMDLASAM